MKSPDYPMNSTTTPVMRRLLRMPLYYKLLIANAAIVLLAVVACSIAAHLRPAESVWRVFGPVSIAAVAVSVTVNAAVVKLALQPLELLTQALRRAEQGDYEARAVMSPVADPDLIRLVATFNAMLDGVAEYRKRLRALAVRDMKVHEAERHQISHDLHDGTAQSLAALLLQIKLARVTPEADEREQVLATVSGQLVDAIQELRTIAQGLRPQTLDMLGVTPALETYARSLATRTGFPVEVDIESLEGLLDQDTELALYRLVQEALLNVIRHAGAKNARLSVSNEGDSVVAIISDDGRGFDAEAALREGATIGLFGMRERVQYAGGALTVHSSPGKGTEVRIEFPLTRAQVQHA